MSIEDILNIMKTIDGTHSNDSVTRLESLINLANSISKSNNVNKTNASDIQSTIYNLSKSIKNTT